MLQHIGDAALLDAVCRLRSLVAPGGFLVLSVPVEYPLQAPSIDHSGRLGAESLLLLNDVMRKVKSAIR